MAKTFTTATRVRYAETDATGIAYYATYFVWFELGRVELFRELGLPYDWRLPIAETYCRYHASARFDERLEIRTRLTETRRCGFRLAHEVYRLPEGAAAELLVEGFTAMVTIDERQKPVALPPDFAAAFAAIE